MDAGLSNGATPLCNPYTVILFHKDFPWVTVIHFHRLTMWVAIETSWNPSIIKQQNSDGPKKNLVQTE